MRDIIFVDPENAEKMNRDISSNINAIREHLKKIEQSLDNVEKEYEEYTYKEALLGQLTVWDYILTKISLDIGEIRDFQKVLGIRYNTLEYGGMFK